MWMSQFPEELLLVQGSEQGRGQEPEPAAGSGPGLKFLVRTAGYWGEPVRREGQPHAKGIMAALEVALPQQEVWAETKWLRHHLREVCLHCPRRVGKGVWEILPLPSQGPRARPGGERPVS